MKFIVTGRIFLSAVKTVSKALVNKPTHPILENIRFDLNGDTLKLTASDLQTTISACCQVTTDGNHEPFVIPAKPLSETLQGLNTSELEFDLSSSNGVTISWTEGQVQLPLTDAEDWPTMKSYKGEISNIELESSLLNTGLEMCDFATAKDDLVITLQGLFLNFTGNELEVVASNARILALASIKDVPSQKATSFIVHKRSATILSSLLSSSQKVKIIINGNTATFTLNDSQISITCLLLEGKFPSYRSLIPKKGNNTLSINKDKLLQIWKRINGCIGKLTNALTVDILNNAISLSGEDLMVQMTGEESMPCSYQGEPMTIAFNSNLFSDLISNTPGDTITFDIYDPSTAVIVHDGMDNQRITFTGIIMPIHIDS